MRVTGKLLAAVMALLVVLVGVGCGGTGNDDATGSPATATTASASATDSSDVQDEDRAAGTDDSDTVQEFHSLSDPRLTQYVEDTVYTNLAALYGEEDNGEDHVIENVQARYVSEDYVAEKTYNEKSNIFFGYNLEELNQQFEGTPYVFTLGDDGTTTVEAFTSYDDTYEKMITDVAVGTGVILVCVTVSVATGATGAAGMMPVSMICAAAAREGVTVGLSSGVFSAVFAGAMTGIETGGDFHQIAMSAAAAGAEGFKWGAIIGAVSGAVGEASRLRGVAKTAEKAVAPGEASVDTTTAPWRQAEQRALQKYGGVEQKSYVAGKEVPWGTPGATRPDIVRTVRSGLKKHLEAIEVKHYDLASPASRSELYKELEREVAARKANMPAGTTQRIVLDVTGRGFSKELVDQVKNTIWERLADIYPNIPIDVIGL